MGKKRSRAVRCPRCCGTSYITADLDKGSIDTIVLPPGCNWPAQCPHEFVKGTFDHQFDVGAHRAVNIGVKT